MKKIFCPSCKSQNYNYFVGINFDTTKLNEFYFMECKNCELLLLNKKYKKTEIKSLYSNEYSGYSNLGFLTKIAQKFSMFLKNLKLKKYLNKYDKCIEIGPGMNPMVDQRIFSEIQFIDLPIDKFNFHDNKKSFYVKTQDASESLKSFNSVDCIIANQLIEHLIDPFIFIKQANKTLNENGILFLETPNYKSFDFGVFAKYKCWGGFHTPKHVVIFSNESIQKILKENGFTILVSENIISPFLWPENITNYLTLKNKKFLIPIFTIKNPFALLFYIFLDLVILLLNKRTSNYRIIAQKN